MARKKRGGPRKTVERTYGHHQLFIYFDAEAQRPGWTWRVRISGADDWHSRARKWFLTPEEAEQDFVSQLREMN